MIRVIDALSALDIKDVVVYGRPSNESEFNQMLKKVIGKDENDNAILSSDPNDFGVTWSQVEAKRLELEAAEPMRLLRLERNQLLQESDWRMNTDYPYSDQAEWSSYRTQLRNLPATSEPTLDEIGNLIVDWPTAPEDV